MTGNNKLEGIWKEGVMNYLRYCLDKCLQWRLKITKTSERSLPRASFNPVTSQKRHHLLGILDPRKPLQLFRTRPLSELYLLATTFRGHKMAGTTWTYSRPKYSNLIPRSEVVFGLTSLQIVARYHTVSGYLHRN